MPSTKSAIDQDLLFLIDNCVTKNPELHPDQFYVELVEGSEGTTNFPNAVASEFLTINFDK